MRTTSHLPHQLAGRQFRSHFAILSIAALQAAQSLIGSDALSPAPGFTPILTFTEKHTERIVTVSDPDDSSLKWPELGSVDSTNLLIKASMEGVELSGINSDTPFSINFGDLAFDITLGSDPNYSVSKSTAFFPTHGWDASGRPVGSEGLSLSWDRAILTVRLVNNALSEEDAGPFLPALSANYSGENNASIRHIGNLSLTFGSLVADATVFIKGTASTATSPFGSGSSTQPFDLTQSDLSAGLDLAPPSVVVSGTKTASNPHSDDTGLLLRGTASDGHGLKTVQISTAPDLPGSWTDLDIGSPTPLPAEEDQWSGGTVKWSYLLPETGIGTTQFYIRALDLAGNSSTLVSFTIAKDVPEALTGRWDSLIRSSDGSNSIIGSLSIYCSSLGALTGQVTLNGRTQPFIGSWSGDHIQGKIKRASGGDLRLDAFIGNIDVEGPESAWIEGLLYPLASSTQAKSMADGEQPTALGQFAAFRSPYSATSRAADSIAGRYHASVSAPANGVLGKCVLSANVNTAGGVRIIAKLADGATVTWGGVLGAGGQIPLYALPYTRKGTFAATLNVDGYWISADTCTWTRPPGFQTTFPDGFTASDLQISGQLYQPPAQNSLPLELSEGPSNAFVSLQGDGLETPYAEWFTLDSRGRATFDAPNTLSLRAAINTSTGIAIGGFKLPPTEASPQPRNAILYGLVIGNTVEGYYAAPNPRTQNSLGSFQISAQDPQAQDPGNEDDEDGEDGEDDFGDID